MGLNELFMQRMNLERNNRINMQPEINSGLGNLLGAVVGSVVPKIMEQKEERARQARVKDQITNFQSMMQKMNEMPDNSTSAKGVGLLDDETSKDTKGITGITRVVPQQEMSIDENGEVNIKIGMRATTPQEQAAQYEMMRKQTELRKAEAKAQLLDGYIKGDIQEGAILKEMSSLGITPDEFDFAAQARERMRQIISNQTFSGQPVNIPQGFEATEMVRDRMGNMVPSGIKKVQQPTEMDALNAEAKRLDIARTRQDMEPKPLSETEKLQQEQMRLGMDKTRQDMAFNADERPFRFKQKELSSTQQVQKDKRIADLFETTEINKVKRDQIEQAKDLATQIRGGLGGTIERNWMKLADPNNPMLGKWQVVKSVLTDAQLMNTAKTKGAISDREMALFASAAANDDIASLPRMLPVFDKLMAFMDAEERSKKEAYRKIYNENPDEFLGGGQVQDRQTDNDPLGIR